MLRTSIREVLKYIRLTYLVAMLATKQVTTAILMFCFFADVFDTDDDMILSKPWSPKYRNDYRIEPIAIGRKRFLSDDNSIILEEVRKEGLEIS